MYKFDLKKWRTWVPDKAAEYGLLVPKSPIVLPLQTNATSTLLLLEKTFAWNGEECMKVTKLKQTEARKWTSFFSTFPYRKGVFVVTEKGVNAEHEQS
jgi:hypothetical protein